MIDPPANDGMRMTEEQPFVGVSSAESVPHAWHDRKGSDASIAWYGGKYYLAEWIIGQVPPHRDYVEPLGAWPTSS